ncbi:MAG: scpB [Frankiales bacterium]|nr:scpB [Frankiales bacterium]
MSDFQGNPDGPPAAVEPDITTAVADDESPPAEVNADAKAAEPADTAAAASPSIAGEPETARQERMPVAAVGIPLPDDVPLRTGVEAILLVVDEPVTPDAIAAALELPAPEVLAVLESLAAEYAGQGRGFELRQVAGGWRLYTRTDCAPFVERFILEGQQTRLTQAALETLAVVAYRQPVSRGRISNIRGVNVDGVMRTLVARGLVAEAGADPSSGAVLYRTTDYFLERLGINDVTELPELAPLLPDIEMLELDSDRLSG